MIEIQNASFRYANSDSGVLDEITLHIKDGECVLPVSYTHLTLPTIRLV